MGINLGLIDDLEIPTVNKLFIHTQPAHLQKLKGTHLDGEIHFFTAGKDIADLDLNEFLPGTAVRFEPGQTREVELVAYAGKRAIYGFNGLVSGPLDGGQ